MAPLQPELVFGPATSVLLYIAIGVGFCYFLEMAGFGDSMKLSSQFYFRDMTVLKVMFTAIAVAMVLVFLASGLGLLDYNLIFVNPTFLWPGILGGLIMGFGFVIGGFCPGTSLVAAATLKVDGMLFVVGAFLGIFVFGETVDHYSALWSSTDYGRVTLPEWLGWTTGAVVVAVVVVALVAFWAAEVAEKRLRGKVPRRVRRAQYAGAALLLLSALLVMAIGQPTPEDRWQWIAGEKQVLLDEGKVRVSPSELLHTMHDSSIKTVLFDVRDELDFNLFQIVDSESLDFQELVDRVDEVMASPPNTVLVLVSNDGCRAEEAWKLLVGQGVVNVYVLDGGINAWLDRFAIDAESAEIAHEDRIPHRRAGEIGSEQLAYRFPSALGDRQIASDPDPHAFELEYEAKIVLQSKRSVSGGGCG